MSRDTYQIVFRGRTVAGADLAEVKANLARLFKIDPARVEKLFDGARKVLKQGLDRKEADRYHAVLREAGAMVSVVSTEARSAAVEPSPPLRAASTVKDRATAPEPPAAKERAAAVRRTTKPEPAPAAGDAAEATLAPPGVQLIEPAVATPPDIDTVGLDLAEVGATVDDSPRPAPVEVDLGTLALSEDYERLDQTPRPAAPEIDVFDLDLADPGAVVDESPRPAPPDVDVGGLSASADYEALDERERPAPATINTDHLKLDND